MKQISNPYFGKGLGQTGIPMPSINSKRPLDMLKKCPVHAPTPLCSVPKLAASMGIDSVWVKDERHRMGLGSFKALGAAYVIANMASEGSVKDMTFVTASAGNHGLSVATGANIFGAQAVIYLSNTVPESFAKRLSDIGAQVIRVGNTYEASMTAAQQAALDNGWVLLSDTSFDGYLQLPRRLMEGYTVMASEIIEDIDHVPTHIFLQAGVGGLACAMAACFRMAWGNKPVITVVEPLYAPALYESIQCGKSVVTVGGVSDMGRLDCKEPSLIALEGLSRDANYFALIEEEECKGSLSQLAACDLETSPSGGAGFAGALCSDLPSNARVLCIISEGMQKE